MNANSNQIFKDESYIIHCTSLPKNGKAKLLPSINIKYSKDQITVPVDFLRRAHISIISLIDIIRDAPADAPIAWCVDKETPVMEMFGYLNAEQNAKDIADLLSRDIKRKRRP